MRKQSASNDTVKTTTRLVHVYYITCIMIYLTRNPNFSRNDTERRWLNFYAQMNEGGWRKEIMRKG